MNQYFATTQILRATFFIGFLICLFSNEGMAQNGEDEKKKVFKNEIGFNSSYLIQAILNQPTNNNTTIMFQYKRVLYKNFRLRMGIGGNTSYSLIEQDGFEDKTQRTVAFLPKLGFEGRIPVYRRTNLLVGVDGFYHMKEVNSEQNVFDPNGSQLIDRALSIDKLEEYGVMPFLGLEHRFSPRFALYFETYYPYMYYKTEVGFRYENKTGPDDVSFANGYRTANTPSAALFFSISF